MKKELIITVLAVIFFGFVGFNVFNQNSVPTNLEQADVSEAVNIQEQNQALDVNQIPPLKNFSFTFTGYGPAGKFHDGSFKEYQLSTSSIVFKAATVDTGIEGLNKHLCAAEFFDCVKYPEIKFTANSLVKKTDALYQVSGTLNFKDVTKIVSFDVKSEGNKFSADFLLDTTEFNFNPKLVENNVRIKFSFEI
jgi:hypothetical protein